MTELTHDLTIEQTVALLTRYGFELRGYTARELIERWLQTYQRLWVRLAVVEALYQGRYKAISVEHILNLWFRRGNPTFHFTHEFERLICCNLPRYFTHSTNGSLDAQKSHQALASNDPGNVGENIPIDSSLFEKSIKSSFTPWNWQTIPKNGTLLQSPTEIKLNADESAPTTPQEENVTAGEDNHLPSSIPDTANTMRGSPSHRSIHQFIPLVDGTEFYSKLKAVAQNGLDEENLHREQP